MATLIELVSDIVASHASTSPMTSDDLVLEIQKVYGALKALETGIEVVSVGEKVQTGITVKEAFKKNEVICMLCGKGKMKTLSRHLSNVHEMKPGQYKKQFNIPTTQSLTAKSFSDARRKSAIDRGLGDNLAKAREVRMANIKAKKDATVKAVKSKAERKAAPVKSVKTAKTKVAKKAE